MELEQPGPPLVPETCFPQRCRLKEVVSKRKVIESPLFGPCAQGGNTSLFGLRRVFKHVVLSTRAYDVEGL